MVDGQKSTNITVYTQCHKPRLVLYPNIYAIFTVLITMPVSSVSSERSFSAMRRVKNCLYKSYNAWMGDERLSNLWLLHIHRTRNSKMLSTDVWTLSNYPSVLLDMVAACAYMNSETLFFECFFHTFCIYDNLRYRFNALWCWIFVT